jgi:hypothetical protein
MLNVYRAERWSPSQPLTLSKGLNKHPTATVQGDTLWLFWAVYDQGSHTWRIDYRRQSAGEWSASGSVPAAAPRGSLIERRQPWVVTDGNPGFWLFWLEKAKGGSRWQLKYNRHSDTVWNDTTIAYFLATAHTFLLEDGKEVADDLFVLFHPTVQNLWVFWARQAPTGEPNQTRWQIVYRRSKPGLDPGVDDWEPIQMLPKAILNGDDNHDDREPAALVNDAGQIELFWSSTRDGSWSIWHNILDQATGATGASEPITANPYTQRNPLPFANPDDADLWLLYRSNESLTYKSTLYRATATRDNRYAGSTTVDTRNRAKLALHGQFADFQTYTYDTGSQCQRTNANWYGRDTVGIYLTPTTEDQSLILRNQALLANVLQQFLPVQVRPIFIIEPAIYAERIYTYDFPDAAEQRLIGEHFFDQGRGQLFELYPAVDEGHQDRVPGWRWLRVWSPTTGDAKSVDFAAQPIDTHRRTWHTGVTTGE